jgi:hypothetical protein
MADIFETSVAAKVQINIQDWDDLLGAMVYTNKTDPNAPFLIDLTTFYFGFELKRGKELIALYEIQPNVMATAFLVKNGTTNATLDIQAMLEEIRRITSPGKVYTLVQKVIDNDGLKFVHVIYQLNAKSY